MNCQQCKKELKQSRGQIVFWHKECRTKGREKYRRHLKNMK